MKRRRWAAGTGIGRLSLRIGAAVALGMAVAAATCFENNREEIDAQGVSGFPKF